MTVGASGRILSIYRVQKSGLQSLPPTKKSAKTEIDNALSASRWYYKGQKDLLRYLSRMLDEEDLAEVLHKIRDEESQTESLIGDKRNTKSNRLK